VFTSRTDDYFLALGWYKVWLGGSILLKLHCGAIERLDKHSCRDKSSFGSKVGNDFCCDVIVPEDVVELLIVFVDLMDDNFGVAVG
jgi:hypothetical protein